MLKLPLEQNNQLSHGDYQKRLNTDNNLNFKSTKSFNADLNSVKEPTKFKRNLHQHQQRSFKYLPQKSLLPTNQSVHANNLS